MKKYHAVSIMGNWMVVDNTKPKGQKVVIDNLSFDEASREAYRLNEEELKRRVQDND